MFENILINYFIITMKKERNSLKQSPRNMSRLTVDYPEKKWDEIRSDLKFPPILTPSNKIPISPSNKKHSLKK